MLWWYQQYVWGDGDSVSTLVQGIWSYYKPPHITLIFVISV